MKQPGVTIWSLLHSVEPYGPIPQGWYENLTEPALRAGLLKLDSHTHAYILTGRGKLFAKSLHSRNRMAHNQ